MKAIYITPHIYVELLECEDVIATSGTLQNGGNYNADSENNITDWEKLY